MAAPVPLRRMLLPLYAFNLEVARAPWVTKEPLIAQMRLQWWSDALEEIAAGKTPRRHEVVTPLAEVLDMRGARDLETLVAARQADVEGLTIGQLSDLTRYIDGTLGTLLWTAARLAGMEDESAARDAGLAHGLAAWLTAAPDLTGRGRTTLPPGDSAERTRELAAEGRTALARFRQARIPRSARPVFLVLSDTEMRLRAFEADPEPPETNPVRSRLRLTWKTLMGRV